MNILSGRISPRAAPGDPRRHRPTTPGQKAAVALIVLVYVLAGLALVAAAVMAA